MFWVPTDPSKKKIFLIALVDIRMALLPMQLISQISMETDPSIIDAFLINYK